MRFKFCLLYAMLPLLLVVACDQISSPLNISNPNPPRETTIITETVEVVIETDHPYVSDSSNGTVWSKNIWQQGAREISLHLAKLELDSKISDIMWVSNKSNYLKVPQDVLTRNGDYLLIMTNSRRVKGILWGKCEELPGDVCSSSEGMWLPYVAANQKPGLILELHSPFSSSGYFPLMKALNIRAGSSLE